MALQAMHDGKYRHIYIAMPPRSGKSYLVSLFSSWLIGRDPNITIMRNTNTTRLFNKFSYEVRDMIRMPLFREVFPNSRLSKDSTAVHGWKMRGANQVTYFGGGVGGSIIGFGALVGITDDLYKGHQDALSPVTARTIKLWYDSSMRSRLEKGALRIEIGTRWIKKDIMGQNLADGKYDYVCIIKAMNDDGTSFCEDVLSTKEYMEIKATTEAFIWLSQYQQAPIEVEGTLFPAASLKQAAPVQFNGGLNIAYIDTADAGDDYYCAVFGYVERGSVFVYDVFMNKYDLEINEQLIVDRCRANKVNYIVVETNSFGRIHKQHIQKELQGITVYGKWQKANKHLRIIAQAGYIKRYFMFRQAAEQDKEYSKFMEQVNDFITIDKSGQNDDAPDAMAGLSEHLSTHLNLL